MAFLAFEQNLQAAIDKLDSRRGATALSAGIYQHHGVMGNPDVTSWMVVVVSSRFLVPLGLDSDLDLRHSIMEVILES